jgi:heme/copper-type cytochrome/quinol oxidase subunit 2
MRRFVLPAIAMAGALTATAVPAMAAGPTVEIRLVLEKNRWQPDVIKVKAGAPFVLVITNKDTGPEEFDMPVPRIEKVIMGGKTVKLRMPALKPGTYPFLGEFHSETAKAKIVAE